MKKMKTKPNLVNDGSKEPQKHDKYSTSSSEKNSIDFELLWRCITKIQIESNRQNRIDLKEVHERGNNKKE